MNYNKLVTSSVFQLETLPKEDLIKFAKKQMMLIQKAKSRCTGIGVKIFILISTLLNHGYKYWVFF